MRFMVLPPAGTANCSCYCVGAEVRPCQELSTPPSVSLWACRAESPPPFLPP